MGMTGYGKSWWSKIYHRLWKRSIVYDPAGSFPVKQWYRAADILEQWTDTPPPATFSYGFMDKGPDAIGGIGDAVYYYGNMIYFIEECATVFKKGMAICPEWLTNITFTGRHQACSLVLIAQRPTYIPVDIRSQANRVITFTQHEDSDTDWMKAFFGRERMKALPTLERFKCFDYHNGQVTEYSIKPLVKKHYGIILDSTKILV